MYPWKIWYDDGSTFTNEDGDPEYAHVDGVQAILQWLPHGNYDIISTSDYYWWLWDRWVGGSLSGLERYLRKRDQIQVIIIFGRWTSSLLFEKITKQVHGEVEEEKIREEKNLNGSI